MTVTHSRRSSYFEQRIEPDGECWRWTGAVHVATPERGGARYGKAQLWTDGQVSERWYAHRLSWVIHRGEIPDGLTIDHLCRNTLCVNPDHLDPVPVRVNNARAAAMRRARNPRCPKGHLDWAPSASGRYCAECNRIRVRENKRKARGA